MEEAHQDGVVERVEDPEMVRIRDLQPNIMTVVRTDTGFVRRRRSFAWHLWDAWLPKNRKRRRRQLMRQETPIADLLWGWWRWVRYSKEERAKHSEWIGMKLNFDNIHSFYKKE